MKNENKKPIAYILVLIIVSMLFNGSITSVAETPHVPPHSEAAFQDIQGHWAEKAIHKAFEAGFVQGYADGMFRPNSGITRAEFVSMINRALQLRDENVFHLTFTDIEDTDWYYKDIQKASYARYVSGFSNEEFLPNKCITREEAATMLARFLPKAGFQSGQSLDGYRDASVISDWARGSFAVVVNMGYIKGRANGTLAPPATLTRAEAAHILGSVLEKETIIHSDTVLSQAGDILKNSIIIGNLIIEAPAGEGDVVLQNSSALSRVYVLGSRSGAVTLKDTNIPQLILSRSGPNVSIVADGDNRIFICYAFSGNYLVDKQGERLIPGNGGIENEIRLVGPISDAVAVRITSEIAQRLLNESKVTEEAVREAVWVVKPKSIITTDQYGAVIATFPAPPKKRVRPFVNVTGISVAPPVIISGIGSHPVIISFVSPSNATNKNVVWSSSDESVATIQNGVLTLHKMGTATISAITIDGGKTADTFVSVPTQAEARAFWSFNEILNSVNRSLDAINLMEEAHLSWAEGLFLAENGHMQRISRNLPFVPGREEFLEYYLSPVVNRIVAAREAFDEIQLYQVKKSIEESVYTMSQSAVIDEASVKASIERKLTELALTGITTEVTKIDYLPAVAGTEVDPVGVNGSYTFRVAMTKIMYYLTVEGITTPLTMEIIATPYPEE